MCQLLFNKRFCYICCDTHLLTGPSADHLLTIEGPVDDTTPCRATPPERLPPLSRAPPPPRLGRGAVVRRGAASQRERALVGTK